MEVPNRDQEETAIALILLPIFEEWTRDMLRLVGFVPWEAYRQRVQESMTQRLAAVYLFIVLRFEADRGASFDMDAMGASAVSWASARASELATNLVASVKATFGNLISSFFSGGPVGGQAAQATAEEARKAIGGILTRERAGGIAATEVTAAQSAGQIQAVQVYQAQTGLLLDGIWQVELNAIGLPDSRVCKICKPLHGTGREVWGLKFPGGPPAHPRCRCTLTYR